MHIGGLQVTVARYPKKTGHCDISGCNRKPTDWHHVISQGQIKKRGLPKSFYTDPGNLSEFCRYHHDMTTASLTRKYLERNERKIAAPKAKQCNRCGRTSHTRSKCYASTTVDGVEITTKSWKYRPKSEAKTSIKKPAKKKPAKKKATPKKSVLERKIDAGTKQLERQMGKRMQEIRDFARFLESKRKRLFYPNSINPFQRGPL